MNPDCNFYNNINSKCNYYTEQQLDANVNVVNYSFQCQEFKCEFKKKIVDYLDELAFKFDIVAITETWIQSECVTDFQLNEYELFSVCRKMKGGGGVALYIRNAIHCKLLSAKSFATDDILECVTVELSVSKPMRKTVTISCIYRTPGSKIDMFIASLEKHIHRQ